MATSATLSPFETTATSGGGDYELIPSGSYPAVLVGLIDLGTSDDEYNGKAIEKRSIALIWELPGEIKTNGEPHIIARDFSAYFSPSSKIRLLIEGWRGKKFEDGEPFSYEVLLGKECLLNIVHKKTGKGKTVHEVSGATKPPRGVTVPKPHHDLVKYVVGAEPPQLDWLPFIYGQSIPDIILDSKEMKGKPAASSTSKPATDRTSSSEDDPDPIPF